MARDFKPSDVIILPVPFVGTFSKTEIECAVALIVWVLQKTTNEWESVDAVKAQTLVMEDAAQNIKSMWLNPFLFPDVIGAAEAGWVLLETKDGIQYASLLPVTLDKLQGSGWVRDSTAVQA